MRTYRCRLITPGSQALIEKTLVSDSRQALKRHLEEQGHFVMDIRAAEGGGWFALWGGGRMKPREFYAFNREFAVLLKSGMPIVAALDGIVESEPENRFNRLLAAIREDIAQGESLSGAFGKYSHIFSKLYSTTLQAGEKSGDIPEALGRYIEYLKRVTEIRQKVITASVYPAILTVVSVFTLMFLMLYVVPAFAQSFFEAGTELPAMTRLMIDMSRWIKDQSIYGLPAAMVLAAGAVWFYRSDQGRARVDRWKLRMPYLGEVYRHYAAAKLSRTLATVLKGGTPLPEAVRISAEVTGNRHLEGRMKTVYEDLEKGAGFAASLKRSATLPRLAVRMIGAGESSGALDQVLRDVSDFYEAEVDTRLAILTSAIEPGLMVLMGLIIGFIVLSMYLPVFQLAGTIR